MTDVMMPRLSDSMEEGTIVTWHVSDGAQVKPGQELAEIETDKATVSFEAEAEGTIKLLVQAGETVPLGAVIARIGGEGEAEGVPPPARAGSAAPADAAAEPESSGAGLIPSASNGQTNGGAAGRPAASPLARRLAASLGVSLTAIVGSGPRKRIVRSDVERAAGAPAQASADQEPAAQAPSAAQAPAAAEAPAAADAPAVAQTPVPAMAAAAPLAPLKDDVSLAKGEVTLVELSRTQQLIARRMAESRATVPDFEVAVEVDMEAAWALRERLKADATPGAVVPSLNDLVVLACARALKEHPQVNGSYRDGQVQRYVRVNVGVAIAAPDSLVVATVFDADRRSLGDIARETRRLAAEVREGTIAPPALAGATFTVSNLGMFGVTRFSAVINAPQAGILAVGAVQQRAVVHEGEIAARRCMTISLAADHRLLYGADAAQFLARVRELLEQPLLALVA
jgi:pyruvate dehydrogenase E2 component (dihydrolipoamide acetyltransferase)